MDYGDLIKSGKALYLRKVFLTIESEGGGAGKRITDLRIRFNVEKTNESTPNAAEIEVYNLSAETRALVEAANTRVVLEAGYETTVATIFSGNVTKAVHKDNKRAGKKGKKGKVTQTLFDGPDIITRIECGDGDNRFRNATIDMGFPAGASTRAIFKALSEKMGLPISTSEEDIPDTQYAHGISLSGLVREHLTDLCRKNTLEWSIQDETLQIIPEGKPTRDEMVVLSAETGLVGSPCKTAKGVEFISLLQPKLRPGRRVDIQGRALKGVFKIRKVVHTGDSRRDMFVSKCEATA